MKGSIMATNSHEIFRIFAEPTVELAEARMTDEFERLLSEQGEFLALAVSRNGRTRFTVRNGKLESTFGRYENPFPQDVFSGEQGTGLLRHSPDFFAVYDLAELIETGISKSDLYDISRLNSDLGIGLVLGYAREPRATASERSIIFADLFVDALKSGNRETVAKVVELIRADWS